MRWSTGSGSWPSRTRSTRPARPASRFSGPPRRTGSQSTSSRRRRPPGPRATASRQTARTPSCSRGLGSPGSCTWVRGRTRSSSPLAISRAREQLRQDLMRCRHRVSKLLLQHGRVSPEPTTWNTRHQNWLARQRFEHEPTELAFIDLLAAVDGLMTRKAALEQRLAGLAQDERLAPTVARLRAFRGIDTLTALALHLELGGDWERFSSPRKLFS